MAEPVDPEEIFRQFGDVFADLFGNQPGAAGPLRRDVRRKLHVRAGEAADGGTREIETTRVRACPSCHGRGAPQDAERIPCESCEGRGTRLERRGMFTMQRTCERCQGAGGRFTEVCEACEGERGEKSTHSLAVKIPAGARNGQVLRLAGMGNDLDDGEGPGALLLTMLVAEDPDITRDGDDLKITQELDHRLAEEGGTIEVARFGEPLRVEVPAGTKTGDTVRRRGYGALKPGAPAVPLPSGDEPYRAVDASEHRGDLVVTFVRQGESLGEPRFATDEEPFDPRAVAAVVALSAILLAVLWLAGRLL